MNVLIESLQRYPVKGLSGEALASVELRAGNGFPGDRRFGFARPDSGFDPDNPRPLPKTKFYMLARDEALALLDTAFDEETGMLSLSCSANHGRFDVNTDLGRQQASAFLKAYLELPDNEMPQLFEASPHRFTDVSVDSEQMMNAVSLINLDSVAQFSADVSHEIDPGRFRGNIHFSGLPPFAELELIGQELLIGSVRLKVVMRTKRCPATEVNLSTGKRDIKTPKRLLENYQHMNMGVYAEVVEGGTIATGDPIDIVS